MNSVVAEYSEIVGNYRLLRIIAVLFAVIVPLLVIALTDHLPFLFEVVIPITPFIVLALVSSPPKALDAEKPYKKAGALLFANIGTVILVLAFALLYRFETENYSGGGANIGLGLIMLSMPVVIIIGAVVFAAVGASIGGRIKGKAK